MVVVSCWLCLGAIVLLVLPDLRALVTKRSSHRSTHILLGIVVLAAVIRLALPFAGLFHDHNHGYNYLSVFFGDGPFNFRIEYGIGGWATYRTLLSFLPRHPDSVFYLNIALGTLTVLPVYGLAKDLLQSERAAAFSALTLAVLPAHVRLSSTEDLYILMGLLMATAFFGLVRFLTSDSLRHLALATFALVLCVQVRETGNLLAPMLLATFVILSPKPLAALRSRPVLVALGTAIVLGASHVVYFWTYSLAEVGAVHHWFEIRLIAEAFVNVFTTHNLHWDPAVTPPTIALFAAIGLLGGKHRRGLLVLAGCAVILSGISMIKTFSQSDRVMFHADYACLLAVLVGAGAEYVANALSRAGSVTHWLPSALVVGVILATIPWSASYLQGVNDVQREWEFVSKAISEIPSGCRIVSLQKEVGHYDPKSIHWGWTSHVRGMSLEKFTADPSLEECRIYYEQRTCYQPSSATLFSYCGIDGDTAPLPVLVDCFARYRTERPLARRPECDQFRQRATLDPLVETTFDSVPFIVEALAPGRPVTLGFYQIRAWD